MQEMRLNWKIIFFYLTFIKSLLAKQCLRNGINVKSPNTFGNDGFEIFIRKGSKPLISSFEEYVPNENYVIEIASVGNKAFQNFILSVNSPDNNLKSKVGNFVIYPYEKEKQFEGKCANIVKKVGDSVNNSIKVLWKAPPSKSGCVIFSASVLIDKSVWYTDDEKLEKILCEKK